MTTQSQSTSTVLDERYELKARLFSEGNQAAYLARDRARSEDVLLFLVPSGKKLSAEVDATVRADIEAAFAVESPTILPLLDMGDSGGYRFLIMPKPAGVNAWERITQKKGGTRLGAAQALTAGDGLIAAAEAAHHAGSILGFTPKQVWIDPRGDVDVQYYWLERANLGQKDGAGSFRTLAAEGAYFQAPELGKGASGAKPPADQFFIGAILYGLLTGEVPGGTLAPIRRSRKDIPKPLAAAIEKSLAQDPAKRHADLGAFRRAMHRKPARKAYLVPLLLLLLGLWTGAAVLLGGASVDDWQFPAETEARRQAAFEASKPEPQPVPTLAEATRERYAGHYETDPGDGGLPTHELMLGTDGTYRLVDRTGDDARAARGRWHGVGDGVALLPVGTETEARTLSYAPSGLGLLDGARPRTVLEKVAWPGEDGARMRPLVELEQPLQGAVLADGKVRVVGDVAVAGTKVSAGRGDIPVVGRRFDTVIDIPARGLVTVRVHAQSPHEAVTRTVERSVYVDAGPPQIEAAATLEEKSGVWHLSVQGRVADDGTISAVSVNDEPVTPDGEGAFTFTRQGADALGYAFVEIVAVDAAGRATRRLLWPSVKAVAAADLAALFAAVDKALEARKTDEAEDLLRKIRAAGGLIEQLPPERVTRLVHSGRPPRISLDDHPHPPSYFENDGTQEITLSGRVDLLADGDKVTVAGRPVEIDGGRFTLRFALPQLGPNKVAVRVQRAGKTVAAREIDVWIAAEDGPVPQWTGVPVSAAQRAASARYGLPLGIEGAHGMRFVLIAPGAFFRETRAGRRFEVRITEPYYMQVGEVSRAVYERVMRASLPKVWKARGGNLPVAGSDRPATGMTHADALDFARRVGGGGNDRYELPTEAQWELAARAGTADTQPWWGGSAARVPTIANFADRSIRDVLTRWPTQRLAMAMNDRYAGTWPVDDGRANAYGLKNLFGNAAEWTRDLHAEYDPQAAENPVGAQSGSDAVVRGGSFTDRYDAWGVGVRGTARATEASAARGLRLVLRARGR